MMNRNQSGYNPQKRLIQKMPFDWTLPPRKAAAAQRRLAERVSLIPGNEFRAIAGVDIAYSADNNRGYAAAVLLSVPGLWLIESHVLAADITYPYKPGFLAMREGPLTVRVLKKLQRIPDAVMCDGNGVAHPRRLGLASHIGVLLDIPTIGCAKSPLLAVEDDPGGNRGDFSPITEQNQVLGAALRTRPGVKAIYVSPGHRIDLPATIDLVLATTTKYRLPEPIRHAHRLANQERARDAGEENSPPE